METSNCYTWPKAILIVLYPCNLTKIIGFNGPQTKNTFYTPISFLPSLSLSLSLSLFSLSPLALPSLTLAPLSSLYLLSRSLFSLSLYFSNPLSFSNFSRLFSLSHFIHYIYLCYAPFTLYPLFTILPLLLLYLLTPFIHDPLLSLSLSQQ